MGNQHRHQARALRPPPQIWDQAKSHAQQHGLDMNTYLVACVKWLAQKPEEALKTLKPFNDGPAPLGRPRQDLAEPST